MNWPSNPEVAAALTEQDKDRLRVFKACYVLQADGFSAAQARRLVFCRWLWLRGRLTS